MLIKCIFDTKQFASKPKGAEVGAIIKRMGIETAGEYDLEEIRRKLVNGYTIRPSFCGGKENSWMAQQIFMLDIDNSSVGEHKSYNEILEHCRNIGIMPNFIYTSFSHTEEQHRFRLVFVLDKVIEDFEVAKKVQLYLIEKIECADQQCKNLNRIYYSGRDIIYVDNNVIAADEIIELSKEYTLSKKEQCLRPYNISNELINSSFNILEGVSAEKDNNNNYNIKALRNRDVKYLKNKINNNPIQFENNNEFWNYIYHINMPQLLEIKYYKKFRCIFHDDKTPSASIYQSSKNGNWLYKCHSNNCGLVMNNMQLIEELGNFKSKHKAIEFIKDIYNLSIKETEWSIEQKVNLDDIVDSLDMFKFAKMCPQANKNIRYVEGLFRTMVSFAKNNIYGENYSNSDGNAVFFISLSELARITGVSTQGLGRLSKRVAVLVYHEMVKKLDDDQIPEEMLKKAQAISIDKKHDKRINFYSIPSWVFSQLRNIETQGLKWKSNGYTTQAVSYELFLRGEGKEVAQKIYPQHKKVKINNIIQERTTSKASDKKVESIIEALDFILGEKGYATEKDIIRQLIVRYKWKITEMQLKKMRGQLEELGFHRIRTNKKIKEKYGVASKGYPFIIVKKEEK